MSFKTFSTVFLFLFITFSQRIFVTGRLKGEYEGPRQCGDEQTFLRKDASFGNHMQQLYAGKLGKYSLDCGGNRKSDTTKGPGGILIKEIKGRLEVKEEPERCTFRIQAPENHHVHVYRFAYKFIPTNYKCINDNNKAILADWTKFYDGKVDESSLLYSALHNSGDFEVTSTGRDLVIDIDLSGRNVLSVETLYQRFEIRYAFIKKDNGKVTVYGEEKPL